MPSRCSASSRATGPTESAATKVPPPRGSMSDHSTIVSRPCSGESRTWRKKSPSLCQPGPGVLAREAAAERHEAALDEGLDLIVGENGVGHADFLACSDGGERYAFKVARL